jgi:tetratricopeptide (TPR) repeat protein
MKRTLVAAALLLVACSKAETVAPETQQRPSILLVTLDTTRFDAIGADTPSFNALAASGTRFTQAYAAAPQTLPSHSSMLTGLYPAAHGVHENARFLGTQHPLAAEKLKAAGYRTAAFVSAFPLARRFGLARGFDLYDDAGNDNERPASATTDRALAFLRDADSQPLFLWVHYFDPHHPYTPSYRDEIRTMDAQLGRLVEAFRKRGDVAILVAADHGEGLGDHGEAQHGNLLYQSVMHVPMLVTGPGVPRAVHEAPVSTRRVFHTLLDFAGVAREQSLRTPHTEVVLGEAMVPFLQYGWQPQVMAVDGRQKVIHAGAIEAYDVIADPRELRELSPSAAISRGVRQSLRDYPIPSLDTPAAPQNISEEERRRLASLGYVTADAKPVVRKNAPRPRDMVHLFDELDRASGLFVRGEYARAIPLLETIRRDDPYNLSAILRVAAAHSALGQNAQALAAFEEAERIAPKSPDVRHYLALHYAKTNEWQRAEPLLERIVAESPDRLPAVEALATIRERQGRLADALTLRQRAQSMKTATAAELVHTGTLAMQVGATPVALESFEKARAMQGKAFAHQLELGVLYLSARRFSEARDALDRVPSSHPAYAMALFKRAQVSVLLHEADAPRRIALARQHADATTRPLIENERLFR